MSTGHTTYTTFHADSVDEVIKRFTTEPINVSKTLFTALDLVSIQTQTRVNDQKVRRNKTLTEINEYSPEYDEIVVTDVFEWKPESDTYEQNGSPDILDEIAFDRGWSQQRLEDELFKRRIVLAYLIQNGLNTYTEVAATIQAFINDPETLLSLIATDQLERSLEDLREMESVEINADPEKEKLVPRPDPPPELLLRTEDILSETTEMFEDLQEAEPSAILDALTDVSAETESQQPPRGVTDQ
jgi:flagellar protein FlaI